MLVLDAIARRYGTRPSALIGETDEAKAFCIDLWAFQWGAQEDEWHRRQAVRRAGRSGR